MQKNSFTLIELLVVIAIVGVLATIVLVSLWEAKERARLSDLRQFSSQIFHTLGANCMGGWNFDEEQGEIARNNCGYENIGVISGAVRVEGVGGKGKALDFDGIDDQVIVSNISGLGQNWTLEAWIFPHSVSQDAMILSKGRVYLRVREKGQVELRWEAPDGTNVWIQTPEDTLLLSRWNHLVGTHNGEIGRLYVNGKVEASAEQPTYSVPADLWYIGRHTSDSDPRYFDGLIDNVRLYRQALE